MAERHEYVVVGAGVLGLSVARELARRGRDVICLEQARVVGHERGGSKGRARILRAGYHDPFYVRLVARTLQGWVQLEEESGRQLVVPSGLLSFGERVDELLESMLEGGAPGELMTAEDVSKEFPGLSMTGRAVYERSAGILLADEVLRALAGSRGVELLEGHLVTGIDDGDDMVTIHAVECSEPDAGAGRDGRAPPGQPGPGERSPPPRGEEAEASRTFECRAAVLCGGAWSSSIARMSGLTGLAGSLWASLQQVAYVSLARPAEALPAFVWYGGSGVSYGLPAPGEGTYKLGLHDPRPRVDPARASLADDVSDLAVLARITASLLPDDAAEPVATERCFYDNSPDQDFVLDRVGRLVIGAGTSGHGFKFGPLFGEVLADLAEGKAPAIPLDRFSARRAVLQVR